MFFCFFFPSVYCCIVLCLKLKGSREKAPPWSSVVTLFFFSHCFPHRFIFLNFPLPCLFSAIWGQKLHREYFSTSNVFWSLTKANCLLLLPRLEIPSEMKSHPAPALSEWGTANFLFQQEGTWEQVSPPFYSSVCTSLFHISAFFQRIPGNVPCKSQGSRPKNSFS